MSQEKVSESRKYSYLIFSIILLYSIFSFIANSVSGDFFEYSGSLTLFQIIHILFFFIIILFITLNITKRNLSLSDWGFTLDKLIFVSIFLIIITSLFHYFSVDFSSLKNTTFYLHSLYVFTEALILRVLLIDELAKVFQNSKTGVFIAVLISSLIFVIIYMPVKPAMELQNMFWGSIIVGYVYYHTRSILFPLFFHAVVNTLEQFWFLEGSVLIIIYFILSLLPKLKKKTF